MSRFHTAYNGVFFCSKYIGVAQHRNLYAYILLACFMYYDLHGDVTSLFSYILHNSSIHIDMFLASYIHICRIYNKFLVLKWRLFGVPLDLLCPMK